jgi:hypothetical protein
MAEPLSAQAIENMERGLSMVPEGAMAPMLPSVVSMLLAVARDHARMKELLALAAGEWSAVPVVARLTAALDRICWDLDDDDPTEIARAALSAEADDQGTWMGGGLEITYPSAEAGDTDG